MQKTIDVKAIEVTALSVQQESHLAQLEARITRGFQAFFGDAGEALEEIKKEKLYRPETWEAYCLRKWGMSDSSADLLISASQVLRNLNGTEIPTMVGILPNCERQCRPLAQLPPHLQAKAWMQSVKTAPSQGITAKHVAEVARAINLEHDRQKCYQEAQKLWSTFIVENNDPPNPTTEAVLEWATTEKALTPRIAKALHDDITVFVRTEQSQRKATAGNSHSATPSTPSTPPKKDKATEAASVLANFSELELVNGLLAMGQEYWINILAPLAEKLDPSQIEETEKGRAVANALWAAGERLDDAFGAE